MLCANAVIVYETSGSTQLYLDFAKKHARKPEKKRARASAPNLSQL
jgi:hypothetical protein